VVHFEALGATGATGAANPIFVSQSGGEFRRQAFLWVEQGVQDTLANFGDGGFANRPGFDAFNLP